jgi:hypothetical protein
MVDEICNLEKFPNFNKELEKDFLAKRKFD